jgi:hypothetical protein
MYKINVAVCNRDAILSYGCVHCLQAITIVVTVAFVQVRHMNSIDMPNAVILCASNMVSFPSTV